MKQFLSTILLAVLFSACGNPIEITNLTIESQDGSQPLATAQPRFSWQYKTDKSNVMQTTYRIVVASTPENARQGIGDLWDSGVIESSPQEPKHTTSSPGFTPSTPETSTVV